MQNLTSTTPSPATTLPAFPVVPPANQPLNQALPLPDSEIEIQDFNDLLIKDTETTWLLPLSGDNDELDLRSGDLLIADCSIMAGLRDAVIVEDEDGNLVVPFREIHGRPIFGVVTFIIRQLRK